MVRAQVATGEPKPVSCDPLRALRARSCGWLWTELKLRPYDLTNDALRWFVLRWRLENLTRLVRRPFGRPLRRRIFDLPYGGRGARVDVGTGDRRLVCVGQAFEVEGYFYDGEVRAGQGAAEGDGVGVGGCVEDEGATAAGAACFAGARAVLHRQREDRFDGVVRHAGVVGQRGTMGT